MPLFDNLAEIGIFLALTVVIFGDWYSPTLSIYSDFGLFKKWHKTNRRRFWVPNVYFFPTMIVVLYVFLEASFYVYYKNAFSYVSDPHQVIPAITFLFLFNLMMTKQWLSVFMNGGRDLLATLLLIGMIASGITIFILFGVYEHWIEFGTYSPYMLFLIGAIYLNTRVYMLDK